jgi:hypothetical protein
MNIAMHIVIDSLLLGLPPGPGFYLNQSLWAAAARP